MKGLSIGLFYPVETVTNVQVHACILCFVGFMLIAGVAWMKELLFRCMSNMSWLMSYLISLFLFASP